MCNTTPLDATLVQAVAAADQALIDDVFAPPPGHAPHELSVSHHYAVGVLGHVARLLGWDTDDHADLGPWGHPDLLLQSPHGTRWLLEYKSYRPTGAALRTSILQTYGYHAALANTHRAYLILGGTGPVRPIPQPHPLNAVTVTTPAAFLADLTDTWADELLAGATR